MTITPEQLDEWERLANQDHADLAYASELKEAVPALIAEVWRLREENDRLQDQCDDMRHELCESRN